MSEAKRQPIDNPREDPETSGKDSPDDQGRSRGGGDSSSKSRTTYDPPYVNPPEDTMPIDPPDNSGGGTEW